MKSFTTVLPGYEKNDGGAARICGQPPPPPEPVPERDPCSAFELFLAGLTHGADRPALGWRPLPRIPETDVVPPGAVSREPFHWHSFGEARDAIVSLAGALLTPDGLGLAVGDRVGIYAKNCPNWTIVSLAISAAGLTLVTMYDTLGPSAVQYICNHAELKVVFVSDENLGRFIEARANIPTVRNVVAFGSEGVSDLARLRDPELLQKEQGICGLGDFVRPETAESVVLPSADLDAIFIVMYTSGTTGDPKGVVLKNRSLVLMVTSYRSFIEHWKVSVGKEDCMYSFLPLAHIFAQQTEAGIYAVGGRIGYYQGDVKLLLEDLAELKPTIFAAVPRVYARFEQSIRGAVSKGSFFKRYLFSCAFASQSYAVENEMPRIRIWDFLIFDKIRRAIMPRARIVLTGGAPMSTETNLFLSVCLKTPIIQGYGLTETLGGITVQVPGEPGAETCGPPLPGTELKLVDVPEMEYLSTDQPCPRGELYVRGPTVMQEYFKEPELTAKAFPNRDGWFATGDIAMWTPEGNIRIIDRRKNLFKLSQGEYISPEKLEQEYAKAELVLQIFVYGNSLHASLLGVIVPDVAAAKAWGRANGYSGSARLSEIVSASRFKDNVLDQLGEIRRRACFQGYETVRDVIFEVEDLNELGQGFHVDNNLLTPSFKLKRPQLVKRYEAHFGAMYQHLQNQ